MELSASFFVRLCNFVNAAVCEFSVAALVVTQHRFWITISDINYGDSVARKSVSSSSYARRFI